jgi:hypothetical protein
METNPAVVSLGALALVGLVSSWRAGRRSARRAVHGVREVTRLAANTIRALVTAGVIVAVQLATITFTTDATARVVVLVVPAILAGASVARLLAVTELVYTSQPKRGRRR